MYKHASKTRNCLLISFVLFSLFQFTNCQAVSGNQAVDTSDMAEITNLYYLTTAESYAHTSYKTDRIIYARNTFYNNLIELPATLPEMELEEVFKDEGLNEISEQGEIREGVDYYYSLDLSVLLPIARTPDGLLVCKLSDASETNALFVLDAQRPQVVKYYLNNRWNWANAPHTFLLDGEEPTIEENERCERLFQAHLNSGKLFALLDGDPSVHTVTVQFTTMPGFSYCFNYQQYAFDGGCISVFSRADGHSVRVDHVD